RLAIDEHLHRFAAADVRVQLVVAMDQVDDRVVLWAGRLVLQAELLTSPMLDFYPVVDRGRLELRSLVHHRLRRPFHGRWGAGAALAGHRPEHDRKDELHGYLMIVLCPPNGCSRMIPGTLNSSRVALMSSGLAPHEYPFLVAGFHSPIPGTLG